jgi:hypothetical protein
MGRNNEDARSGLDRADIPGFEGTMGMLDGLVSKYAPNASNRAAEHFENTKTAYREGKITLEEAHDLVGSGGELGPGENDMGEDYRMHDAKTPFGKAERSRKNARATHKRAGLTVHPKKGY